MTGWEQERGNRMSRFVDGLAGEMSKKEKRTNSTFLALTF